MLSTYVQDLLSPADAASFVSEASRVRGPGGLLCVAGLTRGSAGAARVTSTIWHGVWSVLPRAVGGCRPVEVTERLDPRTWRIKVAETVTTFAISSQVVVAARR